MKELNPKIYIWQCIISPHTIGLAASLVELGCDVTYVAEQEMSADRVKQGWQAVKPDGVRVLFAPTAEDMKNIARDVPLDSIHLCQGIRGNGLVKAAQKELRKRDIKQWILMEAVEIHGVKGLFKGLLYRLNFLRWNRYLAGVLAIGYKTAPWVAKRGVSADKVFPFAYFLDGNSDVSVENSKALDNDVFNLVFIGQLIERKKVDLLIRAMASVKNQNLRLYIIGIGQQEARLKELAKASKPNQEPVWLGGLPMKEVPGYLQQADCLVLPSRHDGWGAVVSEALILGTPVICSDACGSACAVMASGQGGVFERNDLDGLVQLISQQAAQGKVDPEKRKAISDWAKKGLTNHAGAAYLLQILSGEAGRNPVPPWDDSRLTGMMWDKPDTVS